MRNLVPVLFALLLACPRAEAGQGAVGAQPAAREPAVPILICHGFGATMADSMTVNSKVFAARLRYLRTHGYVVIPLPYLVTNDLQGGAFAAMLAGPAPHGDCPAAAGAGHEQD